MIEHLLFATFVGLLFHGIHRKVIARIQGRPGPPIWQEILHTLKFSFKETWIPKTASQTLFVAIVFVAIAIWSAALFVLLSGRSLLILFGVYLLHKIVEHGMGLSSGSPYGKFGAIRSVISAASELPLLATVAAIYFFTHSLSIADIAAYQQVHGPLLVIAFPAAAAMYLVVLSKMHYGPFSIIEAKEIVSGNMTEHFGVWRAGLEVAYALKTYVLLYAFVLLFIGQLPSVLTLLLMLLILISLSFVCAVTPMLSPYDTVTIQSLMTGALVVYIIILGVVMG
ncbi:MAG TPA: NADH-quinone oxidoreductase subunit H [Candidatus Methanoculleus thermohydrogenotrophicum]|jgi:energy-converting hydrogenase A subunit J|nr:NADH-quinone oxidoreductase subunit H [Candidatus Methanoculleus thermohydrogenotrophicum]NLM82773.1 NADH-ubiquinone oxidoreductase [Candidatus Methanoculleus thermohydrogenotrophicum]HOB18034.1 NADH-quinone oxidoreductase subunit H [Candidatus Methanoculleus thermohydrogenotrophicum]HPZ38140.1 NADH-quinone oxidoreductase subunit H [Candidatus Methanoculleus thermohydrogenotrophicum]HQC91012.1 NADH-quinone oxidoreductase subunit H [Candidatus Methanoculleus thermohydrogenotrophicum]